MEKSHKDWALQFTDFYGDDLTETPPETLYTREDADEALENARYVMGLVKTDS